MSGGGSQVATVQNGCQSWQPLMVDRKWLIENGRDDWIRTSDLTHPKRARYQAAPRPVSLNSTTALRDLPFTTFDSSPVRATTTTLAAPMRVVLIPVALPQCVKQLRACR